MAIQMRRGSWSNFDPTKMLPGEWAVVLSGDPSSANGQAIYMCFVAGTVKRVATVEDAATIIANATQGIVDELTEGVAAAIAECGVAVGTATAAANNANDKATAANNAASSANTAAGTANDASARAEDAIEAMGDISELAVPLMSPDTRGGAKLGDGLAVDDGTLHVGALAKASTGEVYGPLASVSAKGWAEQDSTTGKNLADISSVVNNRYITSDGTNYSIVTSNGVYASIYIPVTPNTEYTITVEGGNRFTVASVASSTYTGTITPIYGMNRDTAEQQSHFEYTLTSGSDSYLFVYLSNNTTNYPVSQIQLELGSTATEYEPYTNGASPSPNWPQEIQVVRGRNLLELTRQASGTDIAMNGGSVSVDNQTVTIVASATNPYYGSVVAADGQYAFNCGAIVKVKRNTKYVLTIHGASLNQLYVTKYDENKTSLGYSLVYNGIAFNTGSAEYVSFRFGHTGAAAGETFMFTAQLTLGSTPQPYVPYGHVGLEVRDPDTDELISCTALPLPQRGWVAGLPDGTADKLRIDGAGKVTWTLPTKMETYDGSSDEEFRVAGNQPNLVDEYFQITLSDHNPSKTEWLISNLSFTTLAYGANTHNAGKIGFTVSNVGLRFRPFELDAGGSTTAEEAISYLRTWLATHNITVLYPLATPVTEDCGYVDLPDIPSDATVSIPELEDFGCTFWVDADGSIHALAAAYEQRTLAEVAKARTQALANVAPVEGDTASTNYAVGSYIIHDDTFCKVTSAIATGEAIVIGTNVVATTVAAEILAIQE